MRFRNRPHYCDEPPQRRHPITRVRTKHPPKPAPATAAFPYTPPYTPPRFTRAWLGAELNRRDSHLGGFGGFCQDLLGNACHGLAGSLHCPTSRIGCYMASLYQRARSPFWWVEFVDAAGKRRQKSTKLRYDVTTQSRQAQELRNELTAREAETMGEFAGGNETWRAWVPRFIAQRYSGPGRAGTRQRYTIAWRNLEAFLRDRKIDSPRRLTRQDVRDFVEWRQMAHRELGVYKAVKNTALLEIKFLGIVMHEALESGFCSSNPCLKLGIKRDEPKQKPAITKEEYRLITRALEKEADWMRTSFAIAWEQGCRLSETCFPLRDADLARHVIRLRTKGKKERVAEVPMSPRLRPLLKRLKSRACGRHGRLYTGEMTFEMPKSAAKLWWLFFRKIGMGHLSFHCTRVSLITRCYEADIPEEDVMRIALHSSTTTHRIYPRLPASGRHLQRAMRRVAA